MKINKFRKNYNRGKTRIKFLISAIAIALISVMSVGYALYNEELKLEGNVKVAIYGDSIEITNVKVTDTWGATSNSVVYSYTKNGNGSDLKLSSNIDFASGSGRYIRYEVTVTNNTNKDYTYNGYTQKAFFTDESSEIYYPRILEIEKGDIIPPLKSKTFVVAYFFKNRLTGTQKLNCDAVFNFLEGKQSVKLENAEGVVGKELITTEDDTVTFANTVAIKNNYDSSIKYGIYSTNPNVKITNAEGTSASAYTTILNYGSDTLQHLYLTISKPLDIGESIETSLYLELENGKRYEVGDVTIKRNEPEDPTIFKDYTVDASNFQKYPWGNWATVTLGLDLTTDVDLPEWTLVIYLKGNTTVTNAYSWGQNGIVAFEPALNAIIVSSKYRWSANQHNSLKAGETVQTPEIQITQTSSTFEVDHYVMYNYEWDITPSDPNN